MKMDKDVMGQSPYRGILYNETDFDFHWKQNALQMQWVIVGMPNTEHKKHVFARRALFPTTAMRACGKQSPVIGVEFVVEYFPYKQILLRANALATTEMSCR